MHLTLNCECDSEATRRVSPEEHSRTLVVRVLQVENHWSKASLWQVLTSGLNKGLPCHCLLIGDDIDSRHWGASTSGSSHAWSRVPDSRGLSHLLW